MTLPAYLYARWSTKIQESGDSLRRQLGSGKSFIEAQGWKHAEERHIIDDGRSAFHGANRAEGGQLHAFEQQAIAGHYRSGAVLVAENIDRLTRQGFEEAFDLIRKLTANGVTVAIVDGGDIFRAGEKITLEQVIVTAIRSELSAKESEKKSGRLKEAWSNRLQQAVDGSRKAFSVNAPGWIDVDPDTKEMSLNEHRTALLNEMFDLYIDGKGLPYIARVLNARNEPTWSRTIRGAGWNVSSINRHLTNRSVLGEFEPLTRDHREWRRESKGILIPDFFPQAVTAEKFNRAQAVKVGRQKWGGRSQFALPNLFSGIAKCAECDGPMHMVAQNKVGQKRHSKNKKGELRDTVYVTKTTRSYIRCNNARRGYQCSNKKGVYYEGLEKAVLEHLFRWALEDVAASPNPAIAKLIDRIAEQERLVEVKTKQLETVTANLMEVFSKALATKAAALENELEAENAQIELLRQELVVEQFAPSPQDNLALLQSVRANLDAEDEETRFC